MVGIPIIDLLIPQIAIVSYATSIGYNLYRVWKAAQGKKEEAIVSSYWGYEDGHRSKDDSKIRQFLSGEIERGRSSLRTCVDLLVKEKKAALAGPIRECMDELDLFLNEVRLGPSQKAVVFFDKKGKVDDAVLEKLRKADLDVTHRLSVIAEASQRISRMLVDGTSLDLKTEFQRVRLYIQQTREQYKQRVTLFDLN